LTDRQTEGQQLRLGLNVHKLFRSVTQLFGWRNVSICRSWALPPPEIGGLNSLNHEPPVATGYTPFAQSPL